MKGKLHMSMRNGGCEVVRKISEEAGLSVSGVYKFLTEVPLFLLRKESSYISWPVNTAIFQAAGKEAEEIAL